MIDDVLLSGGADEKMLEDFHVVAHCTTASGEDKFLQRPLQRLAHFLVGRSAAATNSNAKTGTRESFTVNSVTAQPSVQYEQSTEHFSRFYTFGGMGEVTVRHLADR